MPARYVIHSRTWGTHLGAWCGSLIWSKVDPLGQTAAGTFATEEACKEVLRQWREQGTPYPDDATFVRVSTVGETHATVAECVRAGLPAWDPDMVPEVAKRGKDNRGRAKDKAGAKARDKGRAEGGTGRGRVRRG